ncbi:TIGR01457 family HAD-type hydrolase [Staphylococcus muscae]|uniref:Acid sugar phosphatase n=1 Tax=Staphylococcus muscae TaxID=1294 RepID=A0A240BZ29_9STAP|nr:TIGR01457 family HAD-type hydrolase [Staphylococcus muscae]AVQ34465.1 TIGR01457 family HAD-type hydrolase [Staphylococcus muscae]PNZ03023.1 TIGR01457 family HAD-type hydrolase [Staphylococcus muscae]GGA92850.1 acid sugar phosphatase [Staphylococcus muscae]SNW00930.1 HAD-superfamily hydrolase [Staphylococcus muscae]
MKTYKAYLIDLDGTLYRGSQVIEGAVEFINGLNKYEIPHLYVTNNSTKSPEDVVEKLASIGIEARPSEVVTSAMATADYISSEKPNASVYMIGDTGLRSALMSAGLNLKDDIEVDFVVVGLDENINYEKLTKATLAVQRGATFISTNKDPSIPKEQGFLPGNGSLTSVVTVSSKTEPIFIGKPETPIMQKALDLLQLEKSEVAMIGDLYDTDIMSGINIGIDTVHVQTGVTSKEEVLSKDIPPTVSIENLSVLLKEIEKGQ